MRSFRASKALHVYEQSERRDQEENPEQLVVLRLDYSGTAGLATPEQFLDYLQSKGIPYEHALKLAARSKDRSTQRFQADECIYV